MNPGLVGLLALVLTAGGPDLRIALNRSVAELAIIGDVTLQPADGPARQAHDPLFRASDAPLQIWAVDHSPLACELRSTPGRSSTLRRYRGSLTIQTDGQRLVVVNRVSIEDYLRSVVPLEIGAEAPPAALRAQAIAARSFALFRRGDGSRATFDFEVQNTQAYLGAAAEQPSTDAAVADTAGQLLLVEGRPVEAVYSACCGGLPAAADEVWGEPIPGLRLGFSLPEWNEARLRQALADTSAPCKADAAYRWHREVDLAKLPGAPQSCKVVRRGPSGRVLALALGQDTVRGDAIRRRLGHLPSLLFAITAGGRKLTLDGGGYGHGIGMCQAGAVALAKAGHSAEEILAYYYPTAELTVVPSASP